MEITFLTGIFNSSNQTLFLRSKHTIGWPSCCLVNDLSWCLAAIAASSVPKFVEYLSTLLNLSCVLFTMTENRPYPGNILKMSMTSPIIFSWFEDIWPCPGCVKNISGMYPANFVHLPNKTISAVFWGIIEDKLRKN